jgi:hypothetical protein
MRVALSKKDLACMTCDSCNCQLFARSGRSDELLRARINKTAQEPAKAPEAPIPSPLPEKTRPAAAIAAPAPVAPDPKPQRGFGLMKW